MSRSTIAHDPDDEPVTSPGRVTMQKAPEPESSSEAAGSEDATTRPESRPAGRKRSGRRRKASAEGVPAAPAAADEGSSTGPATPNRGTTRGHRLQRVIAVLGVLAVLLGATFLVEVIRGKPRGAALERQQDRSEAARQAADTAAPRLFSFDYRKLDADLATQRAQTTGDFTKEVENVTGPALRPIAAKEHVVVQAVSLGSAVVDDSGPDVQVLVFLNQAVTLDLLSAPRLDRNRVVATMRLVGTDWKVAGIKAL